MVRSGVDERKMYGSVNLSFVQTCFPVVKKNCRKNYVFHAHDNTVYK